MKLKLRKPIHQWVAAVLCGLCLTGLTLSAQENTFAVTNSAAAALDAEEVVKSIQAEVADAGSDAKTAVKAALKSAARKGGNRQDAIVSIGQSAELKAGDTAEAFVVIGGNGSVKGKVLDAAVVVGGDLEISGEVGDAVVAVMGRVSIGSNAVIHGDVVSVGGSVDVAEGATIEGHIQPVDFAGLGLPQLEPLRSWFLHCALKLRPLAPQVGWVWIVAGMFFLVYLLVALVMPKPVQACVAELTRRPITTFFTGLLTKLLLPIVLLILTATVVGMIVVPFVLAALVFGAIIGKVALLEYSGDAIRRATGAAEPFKPAIALLVGALLLTVLYLIPVLGLIAFFVTGVWGLGVAVTTAFVSFKRESPEKPAPPPGLAMPAAQPAPLAPLPVTANLSQALSSDTSDRSDPSDAALLAGAGVPAAAPLPESLAYPRASFWERMGAAFLDVVLVSILGGIVGGPPLGFLVALAYFAGMWAWKGTTVGGVVLGLKVVRLDGRPVTFAVSLVRGLAAAFSVIVFFLGFLWIAWDPDKQGWHDRIAGTVVIRLPRGTPLVML